MTNVRNIKIFFLGTLISINIFAQPGPTQTQEAGISNYQIQATTPTTTPVTGKQYLYNANDVLSTKDSLNNVQRVNKNYDNYVPNFDMEQGLTPYVFTGVTATLNTTTQLEGLKSINFDATAINDFIETPLITIPRILMGQVCMAKINIKGGDANIQLQVVNGAGTIVGFKQLAVFTDSTPQFITFQCPTQAAITATPALGQLKIKLVQSTATNSALATLDSFYLGRFESNTMTVSDLPQWYYYSAASIFAGDFTFPAANYTSGSGLFTTTGNRVTFLKPALVNLLWINQIGDGGGNPNNTTQILCSLNGAAEQSLTSGTINSSFIAAGTDNTNQTMPLKVSAGDNCRLNNTSTNANVNLRTVVSILATPLPQLATIVNTNTPRAGWLGQRMWALAGCQWSRSGAIAANTPVAACAGAINSGLVINDAVTNGQLPKVTLSKLPKGKIRVNLIGNFFKSGSSATTSSFQLALNGALIPNVIPTFGASASEFGSSSLVFVFDNPTDLTNATIELYTGAGSVNINVYAGTTQPFNFVVSYEPDLSSDYAIPELFAVLPPQVQNSSGKSWGLESCYILNPAGTASLGSPSCSNWVQSVNRTSAARVVVNIVPNFFIGSYECYATPNVWGFTAGIVNKAFALNNAPEPTGFGVTLVSDTGASIDYSFFVTCQGYK